MLALAIVALLVTFWWRWHLYLEVGWIKAALTTTAQMDGLLAGSAAALALHGRPVPSVAPAPRTALGASASLLDRGSRQLTCRHRRLLRRPGHRRATLAAARFVIGARGHRHPRHTRGPCQRPPVYAAGSMPSRLWLNLAVRPRVRNHG